MDRYKIYRLVILLQNMENTQKYFVMRVDIKKDLKLGSITSINIPAKVYDNVSWNKVKDALKNYKQYKEHTESYTFISNIDLNSSVIKIQLYNTEQEHDLAIQYLENQNKIKSKKTTIDILKNGINGIYMNESTHKKHFEIVYDEITMQTLGLMYSINYVNKNGVGQMLYSMQD